LIHLKEWIIAEASEFAVATKRRAKLRSVNNRFDAAKFVAPAMRFREKRRV
jgi:hypothetical protein